VIPLRPLLLAAPQLDRDELLDLLDELDQPVYANDKRLSELLGLVVDAQTNDAFYLAELKLLLALATRELELLPSMIKQVRALPGLAVESDKRYELLVQMVEIELDTNHKQIDFERIFLSLYGEELYTEVKALLKGEGVFTPFIEKLESLNRSQLYQSLLATYRRLSDHVATVTSCS